MADAAADTPEITVAPRPGGVHAVCFVAMGCPCEILVATADAARARAIAQPGLAQAARIERKFSRYLPDSVVAAINASAGHPVAIDEETARLLDYAAYCHELSEGLFDVTCGVLRRAWRFDGSDRVPTPDEIAPLLERIGFARLRRSRGDVALPAGMEIDLGGLAKEYAVDLALQQIVAAAGADAPPVLVNFGGDLCANRAPDAQPWQVAVENAAGGERPALVLELSRGALATSGDAHRFLERDGMRYGHILDPRSGWPVRDAPRSVTVAANSCIEAGTLSTIAQLHGAGAEAFLDGLGVRYWCQRG